MESKWLAGKASAFFCAERDMIGQKTLSQLLALPWSCRKPTKPGRYLARRMGELDNIRRVVVRKAGRGLRVRCSAANEDVAMSEIGDRELEWAKPTKS